MVARSLRLLLTNFITSLSMKAFLLMHICLVHGSADWEVEGSNCHGLSCAVHGRALLTRSKVTQTQVLHASHGRRSEEAAAATKQVHEEEKPRLTETELQDLVSNVTRAMNLPRIDPSKHEAEVLAGLPTTCNAINVTAACAELPTPSVESWADVLGVAKDSMRGFFKAALPNRPLEEVVCADICEAALGLIPLAARPPKAGVAGRHWPNHSRVFWDIDMSQSKLEAFANEFKEWARTNHLLDPDGEHGEHGEGASGNEMQEHKFVEPSVPPVVGVVGVAARLLPFFHIHPFIDPTTGSLLEVGANATYLDTTKSCIGFDKLQKINHNLGDTTCACPCYSPTSYPAAIGGILPVVRLYNQIARSHVVQTTSQASWWAQQIFKTSLATDTTLRGMLDVLNEKIESDLTVCVDPCYNNWLPRTLGYTWNSLKSKFYFTERGLNADDFSKAEIWIHEAAHLWPMHTRDRAYNYNEVMGLAKDKAMSNAASFQVFVTSVTSR